MLLVASYDFTGSVIVHIVGTEYGLSLIHIYMTGVADDGQVWNAATQFDGNMPLRQVAVELLVVAAETAVNG